MNVLRWPGRAKHITQNGCDNLLNCTNRLQWSDGGKTRHFSEIGIDQKRFYLVILIGTVIAGVPGVSNFLFLFANCLLA